jgi:hypothetical protein
VLDRDVRVAGARLRLDFVGAAAAAAGVIGLIVKSSWAPLWAFLILFGVATLPERAIRAIRERRRTSRRDGSAA